MWTVYILECADGTYYTGITNNLELRIQAHNEGKGARYTRGRGPFKLKYTEECENRSVATKRELNIKKLSREDKLKIIKT
jgi:putative endonuclease